MGGSRSYRYRKRIKAAEARGASQEEIKELKRQREEAINREKARKAANQSEIIETKNAMQMPIGNGVMDSRLSEATPKSFHDTLEQAKASCKPEDAWRVTVHDLDEYETSGDNMYVTEGGSTIAVTPTGDIISVCRNTNDVLHGKDILAMAVQMGGTKLDSYSGNHGFYTKYGFEPVSWCEWNDEFAPDDWNENRDKREPIIFYRYVGHQVTETADQFMSRVPASSNYDVAMRTRDDKINNK